MRHNYKDGGGGGGGGVGGETRDRCSNVNRVRLRNRDGRDAGGGRWMAVDEVG